MKHHIHPEERNGYRNPLEKGYSFNFMNRGALIYIGIFVFGYAIGKAIVWWPHILRMLNSFLQ